ncbi:hypothetical protein PPERSA_05164 [Pseudocohnilembus persalinus]|uniref:Uncharacterized protein n=1 Tax=Pseudocohnilembus persalinus TaxID=266149 RepID=A0A0V0R991_PSEPJ|nr:hypothetical protein PPERSA_05164 [Pseudocohnilembus persalinus]|eukprot:KRX11055.1 hypothetical protein PPERSA_05164 [Pseudocohnilembus persalinus]
MNQEKWMDLSINQIIRSKHVKCNMKVDLLKDFFNSSDKVAKNKQYRQKKLNSSILSSSSVNQKLSLTSQNQSIIKQGSGTQQQQPNINNMKRNKSNNNNLWQDVKNSFDSSKKNNSSNNLQQLENCTQEANFEVKKQEMEIDNFLESEAMFYDHIFRDINSIFIDLFYQKFNLIQDKVIQNKNNSQQENRNDRSTLIDKKISLSSQDDENRNSNFRSNSVNENKLQNSQILRQLTVQQKQQINQSKQLRKSLEDKRKTLKQIQISKIIESQKDNYYECNQNSFRQDYLSGYNFDNNQGYLQNLEHSEQYNQFVQSLLQTNKNKQKQLVKKELKLWQQMCLDVQIRNYVFQINKNLTILVFKLQKT